jgi:Ni/Co efflux regulator RcnB
MKTMMAALAGAVLLTAPLAASAQDHNWGGRGGHEGGGWAGRGGGQAPGATQTPAPATGGHTFGGGGGWAGRAGQTPSASQGGQAFNGGRGAFENRSQFQNRGQFENRGGQFANRGGFDARRGGYDGARGGFETRRYAGSAYRGGYDRGFNRGYDRGFRGGFNHWAVGAYLPNSFWSYGIDPYAYGLGAAPWGYHWVLVDDEALLIQDGTGAIVQVVIL